MFEWLARGRTSIKGSGFDVPVFGLSPEAQQVDQPCRDGSEISFTAWPLESVGSSEIAEDG